MTSAVAYEPEEFDNNPFAEQSTLAQPETEASPIDEPGEQVDQDPLQIDAKPSKNDIQKYVPERVNPEKHKIRIKVREIEKNGNSSSAFKNPIVKLDVTTSKIPLFRKSEYKDVRRTYKEIENFHRFLMLNNLEVFVPSVPAIPTLYNSGSADFKKSLVDTLQSWFDRVTANPILVKNQEFVLFVEVNDFTYSPSKTKPVFQTIMATGLRRKTLKQLAPPFDPVTQLAEFRPLIKSLYVECQSLVKVYHKISKSCKSLGVSHSEFNSKISELSELEKDQDMTNMWRKMAKSLQLFRDFTNVQDVSINTTLIETLNTVIQDCYTIKESLTNRHLLMRELLIAQDSTKRKHSAIAKLKNKSVIDRLKVDDAIKQLELATRQENDLNNVLTRTSMNMLIESEDYLQFLTDELKALFRRIAEINLNSEKKKLALLSSVHLIDHDFSLSRLGRESLFGKGNEKRTEKNDDFKEYLNDTVATPLDEEEESVSKMDAKSAATLLGGSTF